MPRPSLALAAALAAALALAACKKADVVDLCVEDPEACPACAADTECVFGGNSCTDTVYCAHEDAEYAVISIGCSPAQERRWPDDAECACQQEVCSSSKK
jgi:hypothetical protein